MAPLQAIRGHDPSAAAAVQWHTTEVRCSARELDADHVAAQVPCLLLTHSLTHSLTYPITAAAAAITGQLGLRLPRGINLASADSTIFAYIICLT